jgi:hypothetical protein
MAGCSVGRASEGMGEAWRFCAANNLFTVFSELISYRSFCNGEGSCIPCIVRSSGRPSRCRLRVRLPQSLLLVRLALAKSQPLGRGGASVSRSIVLLQCWGNGAGDCASGVEMVPKLETENGEASESLRLRPMITYTSTNIKRVAE